MHCCYLKSQISKPKYIIYAKYIVLDIYNIAYHTPIQNLKSQYYLQCCMHYCYLKSQTSKPKCIIYAKYIVLDIYNIAYPTTIQNLKSQNHSELL